MVKTKKIDEEKVKDILVIGIGAGIGDVLLFTPALKSLKKAFLSAKITLICDPTASRYVLEGSSYIDEIIVVDRALSFSFSKYVMYFLDVLKFSIRLRKKKFDLSIWMFPSEGIRKELINLIIGSKYRLGHRPKNRKFTFYNFSTTAPIDTHIVEHNLNLLKLIGIDTFEDKLFMQIPEEDKKFADTFFKKNDLFLEDPIIGFHPGCVKNVSCKRWEKEKFLELAKRLEDRYNSKLLFFIGPDEKEIMAYFKDSGTIEPIFVTDTTIRQTAALIKKCNLFISNDSSLMHIASAMDVFVIGIFGPSNPKESGPWSKKHIIIKKDISCSPCIRHKQFMNCTDRTCLKEITVENIMDAVDSQKSILGVK